MVAVRDSARRKLSVYFEAPAVRLLTAAGVSPNALTLLGVLVAAVVAYLLSEGYFLAASVTLVVSSLFDQLDGALARATGRVTRFGGLLDSVVDRIAEAVVFFGLLVFYLERSDFLQPTLVFAALAASLMVSYVRARAGGLRVDCEVGVMTRTERVTVLVVAFAIGNWWLDAVNVGLAIIAALSAITVVQRVLHVHSALDESRE